MLDWVSRHIPKEVNRYFVSRHISNKAKEKQRKKKPDIHVVIHILGNIDVGPPGRCQGPNICVSARRRVVVAKALRIPYGYSPVLAPMDGAGISTASRCERHATKGKRDVACMIQHSCMLAYYLV